MVPEIVQEDKPICQICLGKGFHVDIDSIGKLFTECCPGDVNPKNNAYCNVINWEKIDPEIKEDLAKIKSKNLPTPFLDVLRTYIFNWPRIKKLKTHYEMLKSPEKYNIVRPIKDHQFTTMHLLTRNQVFQILSKNDRHEKTMIDKFDKVIDIPEVRTFLGWGGKLHFKISGPLLCTYDQEVYDACIKLWHENDTRGIILETNLSEIWRYMGSISRLNSTKITALKRSLSRLVDVSIAVSSMENKNFWAGGIIDNVEYREFSNKKNHQVIIYFNKHMIYQYLGGFYSNLNHNKYKYLTPYPKKIYPFLLSHDEPYRKMGLDKWKIPLGISESLNGREYKRQMNDAIKELMKANILDPESKIDKNGNLITIVTSEAWAERGNTPKKSADQMPF